MPVADSFNEHSESYPLPEENPVLATEIDPNWTSSRLGSFVARACVANDILPTNVGLFFLTEFATHNNLDAATAAFAGLTLVTKMSGAVSAVDMLHSESGKNFAKRIDHKFPKLKLLKSHNTNTPIDLAISNVFGTSVMSLVRQVKSHEISRSRGRLYGLAMALGSTAILTAEAKFMTESFTNPDTYTVAGGLIAAGSFLTMWRAVRKRFKNGKTEQAEN